jgi:hypothetical protein
LRPDSVSTADAKRQPTAIRPRIDGAKAGRLRPAAGAEAKPGGANGQRGDLPPLAPNSKMPLRAENDGGRLEP